MKLIIYCFLLFPLLSGCVSTKTDTLYRADGKTVLKVSKTTQTDINSLLMEMKEKNIVMGAEGIGLRFELSFLNSDTFVPAFTCWFYSGKKYHLSFKNDKNIHKTVKYLMQKKKVEMNPNGVNVER